MGLIELLGLILGIAGSASASQEQKDYEAKSEKYLNDQEKYAKEQLALQNKQIAEENKRARREAMAKAIKADTPILPMPEREKTLGPREPRKPNLYNGQMMSNIGTSMGALANSDFFGGY